MPRGLKSADLEEYAQEIFRELIERYPNQTELGAKLGIDQSRVSAIRSKGRTSMQVLFAAALLAGRTPEEIARRMGAPIGGRASSTDPLIGTFLMKLADTPGLKQWVTEHPGDVRLSEVCQAIDAYESTPALARASDGHPHAGWGTIFADLRAGKIGRPVDAPGASAELAAAERAQTPGMQNVVQFATSKKPKRKSKPAKIR